MTAVGLYFSCCMGNSFLYNKKLRNGGEKEVTELSSYVIETRQVSKSYGPILALDRVSIHVKRGEIYGLIGDNGAGKTTLLKALAGFIRVRGDVCLFEEWEERNLERARRQIGFMIEGPGFFPRLSVEKNIEYCRILKGIPGREGTEQILRLVGLWEKRKSRCEELSMGMKQRLGIAVAMVGEPQILILDEPINGLDPSGIHEFRQILHRLNQERGITILLSSHILPELQQTASTFGFLNRGKLVEEIGIQELKEKCADYIEIRVTDASVYAALLDRSFPREQYQVLPNGVIRLPNPKRSAEEYSRLALEHQIIVTGLERRQCSLEDYYMSLKGGADNA